MHVHLLEWEPQTPNTLIRYSFWDSGSNYLKKYPFETEHLVKDCDALIYMTDYENLSDLKFTETWPKKLLIINDFGFVNETDVQKVCLDNKIDDWMRVWIPFNDNSGIEVSRSMIAGSTSTLIGTAARSELASKILDKLSDLINKWYLYL